jgi:hypothetical protein
LWCEGRNIKTGRLSMKGERKEGRKEGYEYQRMKEGRT